MAGPVTMMLGGIPFESIGFSYNKRGKKVDMKWSEIQLAGGQDVLQWTGGKGVVFTIRGVLFTESYGGKSSLTAIESMAENGAIVPFVIDGLSVDGFSSVVIEGIDDDEEFINRNSVAAKEPYQISLKRYPGRLPGFFSVVPNIY